MQPCTGIKAVEVEAEAGQQRLQQGLRRRSHWQFAVRL